MKKQLTIRADSLLQLNTNTKINTAFYLVGVKVNRDWLDYLVYCQGHIIPWMIIHSTDGADKYSSVISASSGPSAWLC